ncbi:hypothetical protein [Stenotrophomonas oahuensis]|uniref:Transmembrane protein n=1 Tax=Stenotrophomonas oahuensis TaxID=3003271 RepID=A0ABY9YNB3_9GAMM|nr:hypothetical protein [Stenotrophomonas sp. A5586]WNH52393.1 hypothetical protein PDM29_19005 [Stenotrophomonas sp. A5586]
MIQRQGDEVNRWDKPFQLGWGRFARVAIMFLLLAAGCIALDSGEDDIGAGTPMAISVVLMLAYQATGWRRMQRAHAVEPLSLSQLDRVMKVMIGPIIPAVIWVVVIIAPIPIYLIYFIINLR